MEVGDTAKNQNFTQDPELRKGFKLDEVIVLPNEGQVVREGKHYHLPPTAMQILLYLCDKKSQTVSTSELLLAGWGDDKVSRTNLTHVITEIRHALDDHKECPEFIQTLSRKGYRLIANLKPLDEKILFPNLWSDSNDSRLPNNNSSQTSTNWHLSVALLKNSKLLSVSFAFMVATWVLLQVMDFLFPIFDIPNWWLKIVVLILVIGFPLVLFFNWLKEIKIKRFFFTKDKNNQQKKFFFKQLAVDFSIIGILSIAVGYLSLFLIDSIELDQNRETSTNFSSALKLSVDNKLIAVLPFKFNTGTSIPSYFENTFQGELIGALSRQEDFKLVSQRAVNEIPKKSNLTEISHRLGARYLLDGEINGDTNKFSIMLTLTDTQTALQIWSSKINGTPDNLLGAQKSLYRQILNALALMSKKKPSDINQFLSTNDFNAYDSYIQGKNQMALASNEAELRSAEGHFLNALKFDPKFTLANAGLCQAYLDQFELTQQVTTFQSAKNSCSNLLTVNELKSDGLVALGNLNRISGKHEIAIQYYSDALKLNPQSVMAINGTALSQTELGHYDIAETLLKKAINTEPGYWKNYLSLGDYYFNRGKYQQAIEQYSRVTLLKTNYEQGLNRLGVTYFLNDELDKADKAWNVSLQIKPSPEIYSNLGSSQFFSHKFLDAIENYQKAINLKPADPVLWGNLGDAEQFARHFNKAHAAYHNAYDLAEQQLKINPNDQTILGMKARYQSELGQCAPALDLVTSLRKMNITDPYLYYDLSIISLNCNEIDQARELISRAVTQGYSEKLLARDIQFADIFTQ